ncbi:hypothetical protein TcBrA4_0107820 [Trypanosoma cruzi]|nr:hypothetical protein TcBrA4_0107820 [Trypanosoma cruzi]
MLQFNEHSTRCVTSRVDRLPLERGEDQAKRHQRHRQYVEDQRGWRYLPPEMKTNVSESHDALSGVGQREESTVNGTKGKAQMLMAPVTVGRLELVPQRERALPSSDGSRATGSRGKRIRSG